MTAYLRIQEAVASVLGVCKLWNRLHRSGLRGVHSLGDADARHDPVLSWVSGRSAAWRQQVHFATWSSGAGLAIQLPNLLALTVVDAASPGQLVAQDMPRLRDLALFRTGNVSSFEWLFTLRSLVSLALCFDMVPSYPECWLLERCALPPGLLSLRIGWVRNRCDCVDDFVFTPDERLAFVCANHATLRVPRLPPALVHLDLDSCQLAGGAHHLTFPPTLRTARLARMHLAVPLPDTLECLSGTYVSVLSQFPSCLRSLCAAQLTSAPATEGAGALPVSLERLVLNHEHDGESVCWSALAALPALRELYVVLAPRLAAGGRCRTFPPPGVRLPAGLRVLCLINRSAGVWGTPRPGGECAWGADTVLPEGLEQLTLDGFCLQRPLAHPRVVELDVAGCSLLGCRTVFKHAAATVEGCPRLRTLRLCERNGDGKFTLHLPSLRSLFRSLRPGLCIKADVSSCRTILDDSIDPHAAHDEDRNRRFDGSVLDRAVCGLSVTSGC